MFDFPAWVLLPLSTLLLWVYSHRQSLVKPLGRISLTYQFTKLESEKIIDDIYGLSQTHETASALADLVRHDGASAWPPKANHDHHTWPAALQPYMSIYLELAASLPVATASLDDDSNALTITGFRGRLRDLLIQQIDLQAVLAVLETGTKGRDCMTLETYNAFYCCISWCRHAYRWGIVPVVKVAQRESCISLPEELIVPWDYLQNHFGCTSHSGNVMSGLLLNFDGHGRHIFKANTGLSEVVMSAEEEFARIFRDIETSALPIYHAMIRAIIAFSDGEKAVCLAHLARIQAQLRPLISIYYDRMHNQKIALPVWLSHVQGFLAWGAGYTNSQTGDFIKFDGLSGNQILFFQSIDAFLGMDPYLSQENMEQNVPRRQREFCRVLREHSIRDKMTNSPADGMTLETLEEFDKIVKRLRLFRSAHRTRSLNYLRQPAPERHPMTAGKSMLSSNLETSLTALDTFIVTRLKQTV